MVPLGAGPVAAAFSLLPASGARAHSGQALLTALGGFLAAAAIVVLDRRSLTVTLVHSLTAALVHKVARVIPARAIEVASSPLGAICCPSRRGIPGYLGRPDASRGLPGRREPVAIIRPAAAGLAALVRHILEVIAVVSL
jgi:hypothetical protein